MIASARHLVERVFEDFLQPHVHDVRQHATLRVAGPLTGSTRQVEHVAFRHQRLEGAAEALFQALGLHLRDLETVHDVRGDMPAGAQQRSALLAHWLRTAGAAGCRVPHGLLPGLLELATSHRELRRLAAAVLDRRGLWLAAMREEWSWALDAAAGVDVAADPAVPADEWARLPSAERLAVVASLRSRDPAAARDLIASTWSSDAARDRRSFLETLRVGLGDDDEPLLERALDDRSQTVREVAAALLDGLPGSARAQRMAKAAFAEGDPAEAIIRKALQSALR